jgi:hypothetical protein
VNQPSSTTKDTLEKACHLRASQPRPLQWASPAILPMTAVCGDAYVANPKGALPLCSTGGGACGAVPVLRFPGRLASE